MEKSTKIQVLSQVAVIGILTFMLGSVVIPAINTNSLHIKDNTDTINEINVKLADINIEEIDEYLEKIDNKLGKIVLGMCGEFGGKYCE